MVQVPENALAVPGEKLYAEASIFMYIFFLNPCESRLHNFNFGFAQFHCTAESGRYPDQQLLHQIDQG